MRTQVDGQLVVTENKVVLDLTMRCNVGLYLQIFHLFSNFMKRFREES